MSRISMFNSPLLLGFDQIERVLDQVSKTKAEGYPPYNIQHVEDNEYLIELAVAGFGDEDLVVEVQEAVLTVSGKIGEKADADDRRFLHRGIAERSFERRFHLADHVKVADASLKNGLLQIRLVREIPEAAKPKRIEIKSGVGKTRATLIEGSKTKAA